MNKPSRLSPGRLSLTRLLPGRLGSVWRDALALLLAVRDRRTPPQARLIAVLALVYAVSPVDLLPDNIPILGLGDDLLIVPGLLALAARTLPGDVLTRSRLQADRFARHRRWLVPVILGSVLLLSLLLTYGAYHLLTSL
ncbi:YkvA family protein [Deinococcus sonorensis]|uniref:YkvA family protein n=2 Tax=Deinococcus sonorensis TaxID=309891 RepID=A0AAU7UD82_9DEIO